MCPSSSTSDRGSFCLISPSTITYRSNLSFLPPSWKRTTSPSVRNVSQEAGVPLTYGSISFSSYTANSCSSVPTFILMVETSRCCSLFTSVPARNNALLTVGCSFVRKKANLSSTTVWITLCLGSSMARPKATAHAGLLSSPFADNFAT